MGLTIVRKMRTLVPEKGTTMLDVLFSNTRRKILELFFSHPDNEYHLRGVVRRTGSGRGAVARELKTLADTGILARESRANLVIYKANRKCPVYKEIHNLVVKTTGVADVIRNALQALSNISFAFIFGGASRGTMDKISDVDVFVIGGNTFSEISKVLFVTEKRLDRSVSPVVYSLEEYSRKISERNLFILTVLENPIIMLIGDEDELRSVGSEQSG